MSQSNAAQRAFRPNGKSASITSTDPRAVNFPVSQAPRLALVVPGQFGMKSSINRVPRTFPRASTIPKHPIDAGKVYNGF